MQTWQAKSSQCHVCSGGLGGESEQERERQEKAGLGEGRGSWRVC